MNDFSGLSPIGRQLLNRRSMMSSAGFALGGLGLTSILAKEGDLSLIHI